MKVLVLGAKGQVGSALMQTAPAGVEVQGAGRADCDLADEAAIEALIAAQQPDLIINAAAYTAVDAAESDTDACYAINRDAVGSLAHAVRQVQRTLQ